MLTPADVYSLQAPGLATVLGNGLGPLNIIRQEGYRAAARAAAAAKQRADLEKQFTPPTPDTNGGQIFAPQVAQSANDMLAYAKATYADAVAGKITPNDAKAQVAAKLAEHNTATKRALDSQAAIDKFRDTAKANNLDVSKVGQAINMAVSDPSTGQTYGINQFDPESLAQLTSNADYLDKSNVIQGFLKGLAQKQETDYATAARLGGTGVRRSSTSNIFASDAQGRTVYTMDSRGNRVPKIANIQALEQAALQDPQMAALLRRSLEEGQKPTATSLMGMSPEHVTDDQLEALNAQTDQNTPHERQSLADMLRPYGTLVQKEAETYRAPRAPRAASSAKLKAGDAVATPTSDFNLSVGDNGGQVTETVTNPNKGGLLNFLTPTVKRTTNRQQPFDNHYPAVGVSFASERKPYVPLSVNTSQVSVLGADGTPTKFNNGKTNSIINLNATDRSFVLEINGKRLGLSKAGTSADAYAEMLRMVDSLTPEQARKAVLKAVYQGGTTDKAGTSGDGGGGGAKVIGYKNADGEQLGGEELAEARRTGQYLQPVYDKEERQLKVLTPATAQLDAQVARATPGYNPRQRTPQEAEIIRRLEIKGGRIVDPYHTTPQRAGSAPASDRPKLRIGVAAPPNAPAPAASKYTMTGGKKQL